MKLMHSRSVVGDKVGNVNVTDIVHLNATSSLCPQFLGYTLEQFISCCVFEEEHDTPCQIFPRPRENLDNVQNIFP